MNKTETIWLGLCQNRKSLNFGIPAIALAMLASPSISGQTTANTEDEEDVFELSPFIVDASDSNGYRASSTLAGTRLKTDLRDVGASVSVITQDFMADIGVNDLDLLAYVGGTEVPGANGNFLNANVTENAGWAREERTNARPQQNTRVRGLARADTTQNFFLTDAPIDGFNIERVTVNRGPNSALFGLGSPGGIIDSSLKRAYMRDFGSVEAKFDNFGSQRYVGDFNQELIEGKLAVRAIGLWERHKYEQEPANEEDRRFHFDVNFKPFENTTIRANYTTGEINAVRPVMIPPRDGIHVWEALGKPLWDPFNNAFYRNLNDYNNGVAVDQTTANLWHQYAFIGFFAGTFDMQMAAIFPDPHSGQMGDANTPEAANFHINSFSPNYGNVPTPTTGWQGWAGWINPRLTRDQHTAPVNSGIPGALGISTGEQAFYYDQRIRDRGFFDYREQLASGLNSYQFGELDSYSVSLEQTFADGQFGFEAALYGEEYEDNLRWSVTDFSVDMNIRMPDGSMNPNLGRVYSYGNGFAEPQFYRQDAMRVTAFGGYDFEEKHSDGWMKNLGRQVLTLFAGRQESDRRRETHMTGSQKGEAGQYLNGNFSPYIGFYNRISLLHYMGGPSLLDLPAGGNANLQSPTVRQIAGTTTRSMLWDASLGAQITDETGALLPGKNVWDGVRSDASVPLTDHSVDPASTFIWGNSRSKSEVDSFAAVLQSYWLDRHVVTTASWRRDKVELFTGNGSADPVTGLFPRGEWPELNPTSPQPGSIDQTSFSVVAHAPDFINKNLPLGMNLSTHYIQSENVDAQGGFYNWYNESIALSSGETEEYGFSVGMLENKLIFKVGWFENDAKGAIINPITRIGHMEIDVLRFNSPAELQAAGYMELDPQFIIANEIEKTGTKITTDTGLVLDDWTARNPQQSSLQSTSDIRSEGMELELTYNPTPNWRIHLNVAQQEAVKSNIDPALKRYFSERFTQLEAIGTQLWMSNDRALELPGMPENNNSRFVNPDTGDFHPIVAGNLAAFFGAVAQEGLPTQELREWHANLITNYEFRSGGSKFLEGFGIGGALRWMGEIVLGNPLLQDEFGNWVPDIQNPFMGPSETKLDLWITYSYRLEKANIDGRLRFGIKNAFGSSDVIPVNANPDGRVQTFRLEQPRIFELTNTFSF